MSVSFSSVRVAAVRVTTGILIAACSGAVDVGDPVASITITPTLASVAAGASLTLGTHVFDAAGNPMTGVRVSWSTEDARIATVSQSGVVTGVSVGSVLIAASARGKDAFARISVSPTPVASIKISAGNRSMFIGETTRLTADPLDRLGNVLADRIVRWSSSNETVATVTDDGTVTAVASGGAIITAMSEGVSAVASITVAPVPVASVAITPNAINVVVGQTTQFSAELRDASGARVTGRVVVWSTSSPNVATVSSQGLVTAVGPGSASVSASVEGVVATASITVAARPASAVILSPGQVSIFAGQTLQLSAIVTDDRGQVLSRPVSYASSNAQVASVSNTGLVTGISAGSVTITATSDGASGTASVTIAPEPVALVTVSPSTATVVVGQAVSLAVVARNAAGQVLSLTGRNLSWSSSSLAVASVSSSGVVTGLSAGTSVIIAAVDGKEGSSLVTVRVIPVATVTVSPNPASLSVGGTTTLTATPRDSTGAPLTGKVVGWSSSNSTIASVNASGVVTGVSAGTATITATSEGKSGTASVTVTGPQNQVATVTVSPSSATVNVAWTTTLTATARNSSGSVIPGVQFTWESSNTAVATVSTAGVVTGVAPGTATITASSGGKSGTSAITVQVAPVDRIVVTPANPTVNPGQTVQLTATLYDARDNVLTGRTITWSSSDITRATVNGTGHVTAIRKGTVTISASSEGKTGSTTVRID